MSIALAVGFEQLTRKIISERFYVLSALGGAIFALVGLALIDCVFYTGLPVNNPLCRLFRP